jgi:hypothetical protein
MPIFGLLFSTFLSLKFLWFGFAVTFTVHHNLVSPVHHPVYWQLASSDYLIVSTPDKRST